MRLGMITFDTTDARALARWWAERLGGALIEDGSEFCVVQGTAAPVLLGFQRVDEVAHDKNRAHLDLDLESDDPDRDEVVRSFVEAGARHIERHTYEGETWDVLADPDGNQFCVGDPH